MNFLSLICDNCHGKGYYRKESRDKKPACFGAYHEDNCQYKSKDSKPRLDPETVEEVNTIITNNETIDVSFSAYSAQQLEPAKKQSPSSKKKASTKVAKQYTKQPVQYRNLNKGLRSLLRMLMSSDTFASSNVKIDIGHRYPYSAKNIFVNFDDISEEHLEKWQGYRGYWGVISDADSNINWLNTANAKDVSIPISKIKEQLVKIFDIKTSEDLAGASVLIFGYLSISDEKKKWYIQVDKNEPGFIFIKFKK